MTVDAIIKDISNKKLAPVYFFYGKESYYIDKLTQYCEQHILDETGKSFNQSVMYGKDVDAKRIMDELAQFPMMSTHRVIILKEAQDMKTIGDLLPIIEKPIPHGVLVISYKAEKVDKRSKFGKIITSQSITFESKPLYDNQLPAWIKDYASSIQLKIDIQVAQVLAEYLGNDLQKIANEVDKLKLNANATSSQITMEHIQEQIGISKEFNVFELQKSLGEKDLMKCNIIVRYFANNPKASPIQMTVASLFNYFVKILIAQQNFSKSDGELMKILGVGSPFFIKEYKLAARNFTAQKLRSIIEHLRIVDLQSKGVGNKNLDDGALLTELVWDILH